MRRKNELYHKITYKIINNNRSERGKMSKEYTDKQINSMILFLRVNGITRIDYLTREEVISLALETWEQGKYK